MPPRSTKPSRTHLGQRILDPLCGGRAIVAIAARPKKDGTLSIRLHLYSPHAPRRPRSRHRLGLPVLDARGPLRPRRARRRRPESWISGHAFTANQRSRTSSPGTGPLLWSRSSEHLRRIANRGRLVAERSGLAPIKAFLSLGLPPPLTTERPERGAIGSRPVVRRQRALTLRILARSHHE